MGHAINDLVGLRHRMPHAFHRAAMSADQPSAKGRRQSGALSAGERIKALRRSRGWTQDQLAQATGVSRSAVAQWETGRAGFGAKARLIAEALDVPMRQLQPGQHAEPPLRLRDPMLISSDEIALIRMFRELDADDQACVIHVASKLATIITHRSDPR